MKALPFNIPKPENNTLIYQEDHEYVFYDKLHQHEEIQISFIAKGEGTLVVGDTVSDYGEGDILLLGSNLPHVFRSDTSSRQKSLMLSLFFSKKSFGNAFFELNQFVSFKPIFEKSAYGINVESNKELLKKLFLTLNKITKIERFIALIQILRLISISKTKPLSSFVYQRYYTDSHGKRMSDVLEYTMNHYKETIELKTIANIANMTTNAFCKYFKQRTNKTYIKFLNEIRIENASKSLLKNRELTIDDIALQHGFSSISNFNKNFKKIKKVTPSEFRRLSINY